MRPATRLLSTRAALKRPSGKPASRKTASTASAQPDTLPACLSRPALPAMKAGAAKRKTCQKGKFHGMTASTTPRGANVTKLCEASVFSPPAREARRVFGEPVADPGALLDLARPWPRACPSPRPEHGVFALPFPQTRRRAPHEGGPVGEAAASPLLGRAAPLEEGRHLAGIGLGVLADRLAGGGLMERSAMFTPGKDNPIECPSCRTGTRLVRLPRALGKESPPSSAGQGAVLWDRAGKRYLDGSAARWW